MNDVLNNLLQQIKEARSAGDLPRIRKHMGEVLAITGDRPDILCARGQVQLSMGLLKEAEQDAWRSIAIDPDHGDTLTLLGRIQVKANRPRQDLQTLPGTSYSKYLLPIDYAPSRRLQPRWGHGTPAHAGLTALFERNHSGYKEVVAELRTLVPFFEKIPATYSIDSAGIPGWIGPAINAIDLALLYYFVWKTRPETYLEIGSGSTTCFARRAISDHGLPTRVVSIDPEPRTSIDSLCDEVVRDGLETLPNLDMFSNLKPGDIVFMDGSHRCFMNSDVTVFFLDVLPILKPGVVIHIHDIVLPFDYPDSFKNWYWNEQYMLAAYLTGMEDRVRILLPSKYVSATAGLKEDLAPPLLPDVGEPGTWQDGGSFWFALK